MDQIRLTLIERFEELPPLGTGLGEPTPIDQLMSLPTWSVDEEEAVEYEEYVEKNAAGEVVLSWRKRVE